MKKPEVHKNSISVSRPKYIDIYTVIFKLQFKMSMPEKMDLHNWAYRVMCISHI